jgi:2,3-diaminopropionate biosynthesis protein SbnB
LLILGNAVVKQVLDGRELDVLDAVRYAYEQHARGDTAVPHSVFLRFPGDPVNRIIGLPAYLGGAEPVAGMKWISSFPGNVAAGTPRASAAVILNSMRTGRPVALVEGSVISARRTAASAALASATLRAAEPVTGAALIGCGVINFEVLRFLRAVHEGLRDITLFDLDADRAAAFADRCPADLKVSIAGSPAEALGAHSLASVATTAIEPHLGLGDCRPGSLVLHLSLRDVVPDSLLAAVNIVDDADHVCREGTTPALVAARLGHRDFISGTLGGLLLAGPEHRRDPERVTVFSPFGLGVLDMAVAALVLRHARQAGLGVDLPGFFGPAA